MRIIPPIWNAAIPLSKQDYISIIRNPNCGAVTFKTVTLYPRQGQPEMVKLGQSSFNRYGLHNDGIDELLAFISTLQTNKPMFISIFADKFEELVQMITKINTMRKNLYIEWNVSCPNVNKTNVFTKQNFKYLNKLSFYPIGVKIGFDTDLSFIAWEDQPTFITAINTVNGLGGRCLTEFSKDYISNLVKRTTIPIFACGGINPSNVADFLSLGVQGVQIGTEALKNINVFPTEQDLLKQVLQKQGIFQYSSTPFTLKSGQTSHLYINCRELFSHSLLWNWIIWKVESELKNLSFNLIVGIPLGGIPLASIIAYKLNKPLLLVREKSKEYGSKKNIEGIYKAGQVVLVIEDVITTGQSVEKIVEVLTQAGLNIIVYTLFNRSTNSQKFLSLFKNNL